MSGDQRDPEFSGADLDATRPPAPADSDAGAYPFWKYEDLAVFAGLFLPSLVLAGALVSQLPRTMSSAMKALMMQFVAYAFWFAALWLLLRLRYHRPFWNSLAWRMPREGILPSVFGGPMLAILIGVISLVLHPPNVRTPMRELISDPKSLLLVGAFAITLGPLCEELAFRGFMLPLLMRSLGPAAGILLTSIPFGLLHGQQYGWLWQQVLLVTLAGGVFGFVRWRTGSTAASTLMHATYNLTFFIGYLLQTRQNQPW